MHALGQIFREVIAGLRLLPEKDRAPIDPSSLATDVAEELVRRGVAGRSFTFCPSKPSIFSPYRFPNSREPAALKCRRSGLHEHPAEETT